MAEDYLKRAKTSEDPSLQYSSINSVISSLQRLKEITGRPFSVKITKKLEAHLPNLQRIHVIKQEINKISSKNPILKNKKLKANTILKGLNKQKNKLEEKTTAAFNEIINTLEKQLNEEKQACNL